MRSSEVVSLRRSQVDLQRRVVRLANTDTKSGSARTVPLTLEAKKVFEEALSNPVRPIDCDLVFFGELGRDGKRRPYAFNKIFGTIKKELGFADLHFHDLRHEAISRLAEAGFSDQQISAISGHESMQMVKHYSHLRAGDLVNELDAAFPLNQKRP